MALLFKYIQEEMQSTYLPDAVDAETLEFVNQLAQKESQMDQLKRRQQEGEVSSEPQPLTQRIEMPIRLPGHGESEMDRHDYLAREREEISDLLRSTSFGFIQSKKRTNDEILNRVRLV